MARRAPLALPALLFLLLAAAAPGPLCAQDKVGSKSKGEDRSKKDAEPSREDERKARRLTDEFLEAYRSGRSDLALAALEHLQALVKKPEPIPASAPAENPSVSLTIEGRTLRIHYGGSKIYAVEEPPALTKLLGAKYTAACDFRLAVEDGGKLAVENRFFKIGGATKTIRFASTNPAVLVVNEGGKLKIEGPGKAEVSVSVDNATVRIPFEVIALPLVSGLSREKVIEKLGVPDRQTKRYVAWLESGRIDGVTYYANTKDGQGLQVEHWHYNDFPQVILRFNTLYGLGDCAQPEWIEASRVYYRLELQ